MDLLAEQERRQLGRLDQEHTMELSEWKQWLAVRKEVSGPAARSTSRAVEGCSPCCQPTGCGSAAYLLQMLEEELGNSLPVRQRERLHGPNSSNRISRFFHLPS